MLGSMGWRLVILLFVSYGFLELIRCDYRDIGWEKIVLRSMKWVSLCLWLVVMGNIDGVLGVNILFVYFYYCNKGIYFFFVECRDVDFWSLVEFDDDVIEFVCYIRKYVVEYSKYFYRFLFVLWN